MNDKNALLENEAYNMLFGNVNSKKKKKKNSFKK